MSMLPFLAHFGEPDEVSIAMALLSAAILIAYITFIFYFVCFKSKQLSEFHKAEEEERNIWQAENVIHKKLIY